MGLLKDSVEKRVSAKLGTRVTFEKLNFSLLGGSVEALGIVVAGGDPSTPLLSIRRVKIELSLAAAFKKEFIVKSLTVEWPILTVTRDRDGRLNLPAKPAPANASTKPSDKAPDVSDADGKWTFEAKKVLVVDGEAHFRNASGYRASIERVLAEIKEAGNDMEFTVMSDAAGRRDQTVDLGAIRLHGKANNMSDLSKWRRAAVRATLQVGELLRGQFDLPSLKPLDAKAECNATLPDVNLVLKLLPNDVKLPDAIRSANRTGRVELTARASYQSGKGLRIPELSIRGGDLSLVPRGPAT